MKKAITPAILLVIIFGLDYLAPVVDAGLMRVSVAQAAKSCGQLQSMGMGGLATASSVCDWTPIVHYVSLGAMLICAVAAIAFVVRAKYVKGDKKCD